MRRSLKGCEEFLARLQRAQSLRIRGPGVSRFALHTWLPSLHPSGVLISRLGASGYVTTRKQEHWVLGFFDSGFGGLSVVREIQKKLPQYSLTYLGDNARTPYGSRPLDVIHSFTLEGVVELLNRGCELIIVACNTSSSVALRRIQQEYQQKLHPDKRVLGIVIPTAEEVSSLSTTKVIGILATDATVNSLAYPQEILKIDPSVEVHQQACPLLVPMIEAGDLEATRGPARQYVESLLEQDAR